MDAVAVCSSAALGAMFALASRHVSAIVDDVYMDEIFHVDQMQHYCQGNFTYWNAKISTPPGLCTMECTGQYCKSCSL